MYKEISIKITLRIFLQQTLVTVNLSLIPRKWKPIIGTLGAPSRAKMKFKKPYLPLFAFLWTLEIKKQFFK